MLNKLALALALFTVVLLALVAAITITRDRSGPDAEDAELTSSEEVVESQTEVAIGSEGQPLDVSCLVPPDDATPLLVAFTNQTNTTDDYFAKVTITYRDDSTLTAVAEAQALRAGERRSVVPDPWPDSIRVAECRLDAIQRGEHVILLDTGP